MQEELLAEGSERAGDVSIREAGKISFKEKEVDERENPLAICSWQSGGPAS